MVGQQVSVSAMPAVFGSYGTYTPSTQTYVSPTGQPHSMAAKDVPKNTYNVQTQTLITKTGESFSVAPKDVVKYTGMGTGIQQPQQISIPMGEQRKPQEIYKPIPIQSQQGLALSQAQQMSISPSQKNIPMEVYSGYSSTYQSDATTMARRIDALRNEIKSNEQQSVSPFDIKYNARKESLDKEKERLTIDLKKDFQMTSDEIRDLLGTNKKSTDIQNILLSKKAEYNIDRLRRDYTAPELITIKDEKEKYINTALYVKKVNEDFEKIQSTISADPAYKDWSKLQEKYQTAVNSGDTYKAETILGDIQNFQETHKSFSDKLNTMYELDTKKNVEVPMVIMNINPDANPNIITQTTDMKTILKELGDKNFDKDARNISTVLKQQVATSSASLALSDYLKTQKNIDELYSTGKLDIPIEVLNTKKASTGIISYSGSMPLSYLTGNSADKEIKDMNVTIDRLGNVSVTDTSGKMNKFTTSQEEANKQIDEYLKNELIKTEYEKLSKENYEKYISKPKGFERVEPLGLTAEKIKMLEGKTGVPIDRKESIKQYETEVTQKLEKFVPLKTFGWFPSGSDKEATSAREFINKVKDINANTELSKSEKIAEIKAIRGGYQIFTNKKDLAPYNFSINVFSDINKKINEYENKLQKYEENIKFTQGLASSEYDVLSERYTEKTPVVGQVMWGWRKLGEQGLPNFLFDKNLLTKEKFGKDVSGFTQWFAKTVALGKKGQFENLPSDINISYKDYVGGLQYTEGNVKRGFFGALGSTLLPSQEDVNPLMKGTINQQRTYFTQYGKDYLGLEGSALDKYVSNMMRVSSEQRVLTTTGLIGTGFLTEEFVGSLSTAKILSGGTGKAVEQFTPSTLRGLKLLEKSSVTKDPWKYFGKSVASGVLLEYPALYSLETSARSQPFNEKMFWAAYPFVGAAGTYIGVKAAAGSKKAYYSVAAPDFANELLPDKTLEILAKMNPNAKVIVSYTKNGKEFYTVATSNALERLKNTEGITNVITKRPKGTTPSLAMSMTYNLKGSGATQTLSYSAPTSSPTATWSPTTLWSPSVSPSASTPTPAPTPTPTPSLTATFTPSSTSTSTSTSTFTPTLTMTPTPTPTATATPTITAISTVTGVGAWVARPFPGASYPPRRRKLKYLRSWEVVNPIAPIAEEWGMKKFSDQGIYDVMKGIKPSSGTGMQNMLGMLNVPKVDIASKQRKILPGKMNFGEKINTQIKERSFGNTQMKHKFPNMNEHFHKNKNIHIKEHTISLPDKYKKNNKPKFLNNKDWS